MAEDGSRKSGHKVGSNKGILRAKRERKRAEAEARNAKTPLERRRVTREGPVDKRRFTRIKKDIRRMDAEEASRG